MNLLNIVSKSYSKFNKLPLDDLGSVETLLGIEVRGRLVDKVNLQADFRTTVTAGK
jgi:hypothetical protein